MKYKNIITAIIAASAYVLLIGYYSISRKPRIIKVN